MDRWWDNYGSWPTHAFDKLQRAARSAASFYHVRPLVYGYKNVEGQWRYTIGTYDTRFYAWRPGVETPMSASVPRSGKLSD